MWCQLEIPARKDIEYLALDPGVCALAHLSQKEVRRASGAAGNRAVFPLFKPREKEQSMRTVLIILLILFLVGAIGGAPVWGYHQYGWGPSGGSGLLLIIVLAVLLLGG